MPVTQQFTLQQKLQTYREIISRTVIAELSHEVKVKGGYAAAKEDVVDKALALAKFCSFGVLEALNVPGGSLVTGAIEFLADSANEKRKEGGNQHAAEQFIALTKERLRIMLEEVTWEAARWHQWFIDVRLPDDTLESVEIIAEKAAKRMVNYIKDKKLPITKENLLIGSIKGQSGGGREGYLNDGLIVKNPLPKTKYTAEGLLGRPLIKYGNDYYGLLDKKQAAHRRPNQTPPTNANSSTNTIMSVLTDIKNKLTPAEDYGYTKTKVWKDPNQAGAEKLEPKYGIMYAPKYIIDALQYQLIPQIPPQPLTFSDTLQQEIVNNPPSLQAVNRQDIAEYANHLASLNVNNNIQTIPSFIDFMKQKNPGLTTVIFVPDNPNNPDEYDLSQINLNNADFSSCVLNRCKFDNISKAKFDNALLIDADLTQAEASGASFYETHMQCVKAADATFTGASLIGTLLQFSDLQNADLRNAKTLNVNWVGAVLNGIQVDDLETLKNQQTYQQDRLINQGQEIVLLKKEQEGQREDLREHREAIIKIASKMDEKIEHIQEAKETIEELKKQIDASKNENDSKKREQTERVTELFNIITQLQDQVLALTAKQSKLEEKSLFHESFLIDQESLALKQTLNFQPEAIKLAYSYIQIKKIDVATYLSMYAKMLFDKTFVHYNNDSVMIAASLYLADLRQNEATISLYILYLFPSAGLLFSEIDEYEEGLFISKEVYSQLAKYLLIVPPTTLKSVHLSELGLIVSRFIPLILVNEITGNETPQQAKSDFESFLIAYTLEEAFKRRKIAPILEATYKENFNLDIRIGLERKDYLIHWVMENCEEVFILDFIKKPSVDLTRVNDKKETALHMAVRKGYKNVVKLILLISKDKLSSDINYVSTVNAKNYADYVPLYLAFHSGAMEIVTLLLECDQVDPDIIAIHPKSMEDDSDPKTLLYWAFANNSPMVQLILNNRLRNAKLTNNFKSLVITAIKSQQFGIIDRLFELGMKVTDKDKREFTILHYAVGMHYSADLGLKSSSFLDDLIMTLLTKFTTSDQQAVVDEGLFNNAIEIGNPMIISLLVNKFKHTQGFLASMERLIKWAGEPYQSSPKHLRIFDQIIGAWMSWLENNHAFEPNKYKKILEFIYSFQLGILKHAEKNVSQSILELVKMHFIWLKEHWSLQIKSHFEPGSDRDKMFMSILREFFSDFFIELLNLQIFYLEAAYRHIPLMSKKNIYEEEYAHVEAINPFNTIYVENIKTAETMTLLDCIKAEHSIGKKPLVRILQLQLEYVFNLIVPNLLLGKSKKENLGFYQLFFDRRKNSILDIIFETVDGSDFSTLISDVLTSFNRIPSNPRRVLLDKLNTSMQTYADRAFEKGEYIAAISLIEAGITLTIFDDKKNCVLDQLKDQLGKLCLIRAMQSLPTAWWQKDSNSKILFWGIHQEDPEIMEELLKLRANPNIKDNEGNTPLHELARSMNKKWFGITSLERMASSLIQYGADPDISNSHQKTPSDLSGALKKVINTIKRQKKEDSKDPNSTIKDLQETLIVSKENDSNALAEKDKSIKDFKDQLENIKDKNNNFEFKEELSKLFDVLTQYQEGEESITHNQMFLTLLEVLNFNAFSIRNACIYMQKKNISIVDYLNELAEWFVGKTMSEVKDDIQFNREAIGAFLTYFINLGLVEDEVGDAGFFLIILLAIVQDKNSHLLKEALNFVIEMFSKNSNNKKDLKQCLDIMVDCNVIEPYDSISSLKLPAAAQEVIVKVFRDSSAQITRVKKWLLKSFFAQAKDKLIPFIFELVLQFNVNPDMTTMLRKEKIPRGQYLIHEAIEKYESKVILDFLKAPLVRLDRQNLKGETPLHLAVKRGNPFLIAGVLEVIAAQIKNQKDNEKDRLEEFIVNIKDDTEKTPLHLAFEQKRSDLLYVLLSCEYVNPDIVGMEGKNLLQWAFVNDEYVVQSILNNRLSYSKLINDFQPLMSCVMKAENLAVIDLLIKLGLSFKEVDRNGLTILQCAMQVNLDNAKFKESFIKELIKRSVTEEKESHLASRGKNNTHSPAKLTGEARRKWSLSDNNNNNHIDEEFVPQTYNLKGSGLGSVS